MREEMHAIEGERERMTRALQDRNKECERQVEAMVHENASLKDIV